VVAAVVQVTGGLVTLARSIRPADRATIAGGRLEIQRRDEGGTRVRIWLPSPLEGDLGEDLEGSV